MNIIYEIDDMLKLVDEGKKVHPVVITVNEFNEASAKEFRNQMNLAQATNQEVIPVLIDSFGGQVYALLSMIDTINSSKKSVATIATGKAMSCGAILLSCGHEKLRFATENSTIMIHDVQHIIYGKAEEIKADAKNVEAMQNKIMKILDDNCGQKSGYFQNRIHDNHHAEWYLAPQECLDIGLIDKIGAPSFKIKAELSVTFYEPH